MSTTIIGLLVTIVGVILKWAKIGIGGEDLSAFITAVITLGGIIVAWWGRYKAGGITLLGMRK